METTLTSTPGLTPDNTIDNTIDNTYIGIFTPMKNNLKCETEGVRNYVTADIPEWVVQENINLFYYLI